MHTIPNKMLLCIRVMTIKVSFLRSRTLTTKKKRVEFYGLIFTAALAGLRLTFLGPWRDPLQTLYILPGLEIQYHVTAKSCCQLEFTSYYLSLLSNWEYQAVLPNPI